MVQFSDLLLLNPSQGEVIYEHAESAQKGKWPASSPYPCLNCAHRFDGPPVKIPAYQPLGCYGPSKQALEYYGNFCSFPCARRYVVDRREPTLDIQLRDLEGMEHEWMRHSLVSSRRVGAIAPDPYLLHMNFMSLDEYRGGIKSDGSRVELLRRPCLPEEMVLRRKLPAQDSFLHTSNETVDSQRHHVKTLRRPAALGGIRALSNLVIHTPTRENRCRKACDNSYLAEYLKRKREQEQEHQQEDENGHKPDEGGSNATNQSKAGPATPNESKKRKTKGAPGDAPASKRSKKSDKGKANANAEDRLPADASGVNPEAMQQQTHEPQERANPAPTLNHLSTDMPDGAPASQETPPATTQSPFKKPAPKKKRTKKVQLQEPDGRPDLPEGQQADAPDASPAKKTKKAGRSGQRKANKATEVTAELSAEDKAQGDMDQAPSTEGQPTLDQQRTSEQSSRSLSSTSSTFSTSLSTSSTSPIPSAPQGESEEQGV